jgi:hypothetical protein
MKGATDFQGKDIGWYGKESYVFVNKSLKFINLASVADLLNHFWQI